MKFYSNKLNTGLFISIFIVQSPILYAQSIDLTSFVSEVTLYGDQAIVKRTVQVELSDNQNTLTIHQLPQGLQQDSLQFSYTLNGKANSVQLIDYTLATQTNAYSEQLIQLQMKLDEIEKQALVHQANIDELNDKIHWTKQLIDSNYTQQSSVARLTKEDIQLSEELQKTLPHLKIDLYEAQNAQALFKAQTEVQREKLQKEIEKENKKRAELNQQLSLELLSQQAGSLELSFTYAIDLGAWSPTYELHYDEEDKVTLRYKADVYQQTGEDWDNIKLTLSTTPPAFNQPNSLSPWRVGIFTPPVQTEVSRDTALLAEYAGAQEAKFQSTAQQKQRNTVSNQGVNVTFSINEPISIKGDGASTRVLISEQELKADILRELRPERDSTVALYVSIDNSTPFIWLAGPVSIFIDNQLIAKQYFPKTLVNESQILFLGQDPNIKLVQNPQKTFKDTSWGKTGITEEKTNQITSYYKNPVVLSVFERVPVSADDKVKVEYITLPEFFKPAIDNRVFSSQVNQPQQQKGSKKTEMTLDESQGILKADIKLAPSETITYDIKYKITYPSDLNLTPKPY
ncbi:mucoidy inhibitor MuiA family protein [Thorsellia kenyensis]|uniref:Mucoidy inhibitor MuiA family protein n=1 Tax=Thorsellia kenyensis TaxID=1549888 RepID=A0ABV6CC43_9GAMM